MLQHTVILGNCVLQTLRRGFGEDTIIYCLSALMSDAQVSTDFGHPVYVYVQVDIVHSDWSIEEGRLVLSFMYLL